MRQCSVHPVGRGLVCRVVSTSERCVLSLHRWKKRRAVFIPEGRAVQLPAGSGPALRSVAVVSCPVLGSRLLCLLFDRSTDQGPDGSAQQPITAGCFDLHSASDGLMVFNDLGPVPNLPPCPDIGHGRSNPIGCGRIFDMQWIDGPRLVVLASAPPACAKSGVVICVATCLLDDDGCVFQWSTCSSPILALPGQSSSTANDSDKSVPLVDDGCNAPVFRFLQGGCHSLVDVCVGSVGHPLVWARLLCPTSTAEASLIYLSHGGVPIPLPQTITTAYIAEIKQPWYHWMPQAFHSCGSEVCCMDVVWDGVSPASLPHVLVGTVRCEMQVWPSPSGAGGQHHPQTMSLHPAAALFGTPAAVVRLLPAKSGLVMLAAGPMVREGETQMDSVCLFRADRAGGCFAGCTLLNMTVRCSNVCAVSISSPGGWECRCVLLGADEADQVSHQKLFLVDANDLVNKEAVSPALTCGVKAKGGSGLTSLERALQCTSIETAQGVKAQLQRILVDKSRLLEATLSLTFDAAVRKPEWMEHTLQPVLSNRSLVTPSSQGTCQDWLPFSLHVAFSGWEQEAECSSPSGWTLMLKLTNVSDQTIHDMCLTVVPHTSVNGKQGHSSIPGSSSCASSSSNLAPGASCLLSAMLRMDTVRTWPNQNIIIGVHVAFVSHNECRFLDLTSHIATQYRLIPVAERLRALCGYNTASQMSDASIDESILLWSSEINFSSMVPFERLNASGARSEMWLPYFVEGALGLQVCRDPVAAAANSPGFECCASFCYAGGLTHAPQQQVILKVSWSSCQARLTVVDLGSNVAIVDAARLFDTLKHALPRAVHVAPDFVTPVASVVLRAGLERLMAESSSILNLYKAYSAKSMLQTQSSTDSLCSAVNFNQ